MKKIIRNIIIAAIISFVVLNGFSFVYYNSPPRVDDDSGSVDYKWPANSFYSRGTEGIAWGKVNNDGFNNLIDYDDGLDIDILLMGSSHLEGFNTAQKSNIANILNENTNYLTYNIGISEHTLLNCVSDLESAIKKYKPNKYVVIETMNVSFYEDEITNCLNGKGKLSSFSSPLVDFLQNFKYLKLLFTQYNNTKGHNSGLKNSGSVNNSELLIELFKKAKDVCDKYNIELIVLYHPTLSFDNDGNVNAVYIQEDMDIFKNACVENNIYFINMEDTFINEYKTNKVFPHGFNNTVPGSGHLNKYGHEMIAIEIKKFVEDRENDVQ